MKKHIKSGGKFIKPPTTIFLDFDKLKKSIPTYEECYSLPFRIYKDRDV